jgi:hypothetical protein
LIQKRGQINPPFQKGYVLEKAERNAQRQVKIEKRNLIDLNDTGHFCAILIEIINEPIC